MSSEEFAAIAVFTAKPGREEECYRLAKTLTESTHAQDEGFISYVVFRRVDNPREFAFHKHWRNRAVVKAHLDHLLALYGPPCRRQSATCSTT